MNYRQRLGGAQIAVLPAADGLDTETMAGIAAEFNLSETVFLFHPDESPERRRMRVFSPRGELDFGGHPIIAAAYALGFCADLNLTDPVTTTLFEQNAGPVQVNISSRDGQPTFVQFTRKISAIVDRFAPSDEELAAMLGLQQGALDHKKYSPRLVSCGYPYLIVPVWRYESVRQARFDYRAWSQSIAPATAAQEILLFAPKSPFPDADFNLRLLGPNISPLADPPVGNALPAFCAYLCSFEHTALGTHTFFVDRGDQASRRSVIHLEMDHKGLEFLTIRVGGQAVLFAEGVITLS